MSYIKRFSLVEDYITHLDSVMNGIHDPFIQSRYLGFVLVSAVTVYELAIKDILFEFSDRKHVILGKFARSKFERMNGRIKLQNLQDDYICVFGEKYLSKFKKKLDQKEKFYLKNNKESIKQSYQNVITWRHSFAHDGKVPNTTNYNEVKLAYNAGKGVMIALDETFRR